MDSVGRCERLFLGVKHKTLCRIALEITTKNCQQLPLDATRGLKSFHPDIQGNQQILQKPDISIKVHLHQAETST